MHRLQALILAITLSSLTVQSTPLAVQGQCTPNIPPIATFTYHPAKPRVCEPVIFNATESHDPDGYIKSFVWDFGDGNITSVEVPIVIHHYEIAATYNVSLTVIDSSGLQNSTYQTLLVVKPPLAYFTYWPPKPKAGETVIFNASQSKPNGGTITSYIWNFGDNTTKITMESVVSHVYKTYGNYTVTLNVTDSEEESSSTSKTIRVIAPPIASFTFNPPEPRACEEITFDASMSDPQGGRIIRCIWEFGDGSEPKEGMIVQHKYSKFGEYIITLNVTDSEGLWNITSITIRILPHIADLNEDGKVDVVDLNVICRAYGSFEGHERWNPRADLNGDKKINIIDVIIVAKSFNACENEDP